MLEKAIYLRIVVFLKSIKYEPAWEPKSKLCQCNSISKLSESNATSLFNQLRKLSEWHVKKQELGFK